MLQKWLIALFVFISFYNNAYSQQYLVEHYTTDNGLPQNSIKKIHIDNLGFLWLATEDGLVRYNGLSFTLYNKTNLPFITENRFTALHYTQYPKLIYAINTEGIAFKIQDGIIDLQTLNYSKNLNLPLQSGINPEDWTKGYGNTYEKIQGELSNEFLKSKSFSYTDTSFSIYGEGFIRLYSKNKRLENIKVPHSVIPYKLFTLEKKQYLITKSAKIYFINYEQDKIELITPTGAYRELLKTFDSKSFDFFKNYYTKNGYLQNKNLLYRLYSNTSTNQLTLELLANNVPLNNWKQFDISADENNIFFGTTTEGLFILKKNNFSTLMPNGPLLNEYSYYGLLSFDKSSILTSNGYLLNQNKQHQRLFLASEYNRYLTKLNDTIYYYKDRSICKIYKEITKKIPLPDWITKPGALLNSKENDFIWIAYERGIATLNKNNIFEKRLTTNLLDSSLSFHTYCLFEDTISNTLYIGTSNSIIKYNYKKNTIERVKELAGKKIRTINLLNNIFFIGTEGDGYYTIHNNKVIKMPLDDNNNLSSVHCFVKDKFNRIWMPSNKGLFMIKFTSILDYLSNKNESLYYYAFDKKNGIANIEFNGGCQPCAAVLEDETIMLPSIQGVISFSPKKMDSPTYSTTILFEKVIADSTYTNTSHLILKGKLSQYKFYWASPVWNTEERNSFEFNVLGFDTNWKKIEVENPIVLSNLSKGNYTLQIRKKMPEGNYLTKQLSFKILPKWYETIVFYLCSAISVFGLFLLLLRLNAKKIITKNIKLEKTVTSRTEELSKTNSKLLAEIELKNKVVAIISHDMITPLNYSSQVTQNLLTHRKTIEKSELLHSIEALNTTNNSLYLMALNTLKLINSHKMVPFYAKFDLHELVKEKISLYQIAEQKKSIKFFNTIPENTIINSDQNLLGLAIQNIINNAVKFTAAGSIVIEGQSIAANKYKLVIKDTGMGISTEILQKLKDNTNSIVDYNTNQKMGWLIITDILQILDTTFEIESTENIGTQVIIIL